jgi:predicted transcriptional regulator
MNETLKSKIHKLVDTIDDERTLIKVMEDVIYYASKKSIEDELTPVQQHELNEAISEADNGETITWEDFKNELNEWKRA